METTHYGSAYPKRWHYYLSNAGLGAVEVEEPLAWRDVIFEYARIKESDGVVMMPSIPITFGGEGAEYLRRAVYAGAEPPVTLRIEHLQVDGTRETCFEGALSVESFVDNTDSVDIQAEDASLENLVNSKAKVAYEIPFSADKQVVLQRLGVSMPLEAVNTDGVTRYLVPSGYQNDAPHDMALPVEITLKGDPFLYDVAAPDVLITRRAVNLSLDISSNFSPVATVTTDPANPNNVSGGSVGGSPQLTLVVYGADGTAKTVRGLSHKRTERITLSLDRNDLVTLEVRGATFSTTAPDNSAGDNYLQFKWSKVDPSEPMVTVKAATTHAVRGRFACITACEAFTALMSAIATGIGLTVEYQEGLGLETYALFTTGAVAGATDGTLNASFNDFRDFFALLGIGVAFDEVDGKPRCYVAFNTRTEQTETLWPTDNALIAAVGDGWTDMSIQFNEEALFGSVEIGWDGVKDYEIIPYLSDYCGKNAYVNAQNSTSATKQLLSKWRADTLGVADLLLQVELNGADSVKGNDIWVLACFAGQTDPLQAEWLPSSLNTGTYYEGIDALYNLRLRPTALMGYVKPLLAVPLGLFPEQVGNGNREYRLASSSSTQSLYIEGKPDAQGVKADVPPTHLPVYAAFSSSLHDNLWQLMREPTKRYGYFSFDYRGVTLKGFIRTVKYNPTEESSQRCELYLTPDTDLFALIK